VAFGSLAALLPDRVVGALVIVAFTAGGLILLLGAETDEPEEGTEQLAVRACQGSTAAASAFGLVFMAEWGDLTQLMTANLVARSEAPVSVAVGALAALWTVAAIGIMFGRILLRSVPLVFVRRVSGVLLLGLAAWSVIDVVRG
jgi:Ca2+/H+ antiporter, TMEM165/GDT1 family